MFFRKEGKETAKPARQSDDRIKVDTKTITTMIGADTVFEGVINTKASIRINGVVKGEVKSAGIVILTQTGRIEGTIEAESIIVAGRIDGNLSIRDKVNVEPTGQIYGEIITKKFVIDEESVFEGNVIMNRDGKVMPVTPYVTAAQKEKEEALEKSIREKIEKELKENDKDEKEKKPQAEADKDEKSKAKDDKDKKPKAKDETDDNKKANDIEDKKPEAENDKDEKSESKEAEDKKNDDKDGRLENKERKDAEIIITDINELKDGEDIPKTEARDDSDKRSSIKKSKSLSVEVQDE